MGLTRGEKDQTGGVHQSGTASSPRLNIPKPHLPKLEVPHLKTKEKHQERSDKEDSPKRHRHIRRPRGGDHGSHKQLLSIRNPFSKKKPTEAAPAPAGDIGSPQPIPQPTPQPILSEPKKAIEPSPQPERQAPPPPPAVAESKSLLAVEYVENGRQKSEGGDALPAPVGYRHSFGESICGSKGPVHDFPEGPVGVPHAPDTLGSRLRRGGITRLNGKTPAELEETYGLTKALHFFVACTPGLDLSYSIEPLTRKNRHRVRAGARRRLGEERGMLHRLLASTCRPVSRRCLPGQLRPVCSCMDGPSSLYKRKAFLLDSSTLFSFVPYSLPRHAEGSLTNAECQRPV